MLRLSFLLSLTLLSIIQGQEVKIVNGTALYFKFKEDFLKIKEFDSEISRLQGYDVVDTNYIFLAYMQKEDSEASSILAIYDIENETEHTILDLGATGESFFTYNHQRNTILFNWYDGLYVIDLPQIDQYFLSSNSSSKIEPKLIYSCIECYLPFWISINKIGFKEFFENNFITKTLKLK